MKERLIGLLNLKVAESRYVFDLLSIQLFIGIANSLLNIVSLTYFLHQFSVDSIPYGYVAIALTLWLLNVGYERLEHRLSPLSLLQLIILSSAAILFLFWITLTISDQQTVIFLLLVWGTLFYMVTGYAYWGLVSLLFNVRESKRVFSIVGAGDIPAKLIGYIAAPLLIPIIGLDNLLLLAVASLLVGGFLLYRLIRHKRWEKVQQRIHHQKHQHHKHASNDSLMQFFFRNKLIFTISLLSLLSYNVFNLVDYTFVSQVKSQVKSISSLATYVAVFFGAGRLVAFVMKLVFTSRVIEQLGIIAGLIITPAALFLFSLLFLVFDSGDYTLYIFGAMAMLVEVLRSAMQEPVFFILFQPLNEHHRLRGHIIAKGYMLAPSLLIVGASLIGLKYLDIELSIPFTIRVLLLNLVIWVGIIFYIRREYAKQLHTSIARGVFSGEVLKTLDPVTIGLLMEKIEKGHEGEKIYSLSLLERSNYSGIDQLLEEQLHEGTPGLKKYSLHRLVERDTLRIDLLEERVEEEPDPEVKEQLVSILCKRDLSYLRSLSRDLSGLEYSTRRNVIVHLLNQNEFALLHKAGNEIHQLLGSAVPAERILALDIISELKSITFTEAIVGLLSDNEPTVRRQAIVTACKLKNRHLLPFIFERLDKPEDHFMAIQGLFQYGDELFDDIRNLDKEWLYTHRADLIKIAARARGPLSNHFLLKSLTEDPEYTERVVHVLWQRSFQAESVEQIFFFQSLVTKTITQALEKIEYHYSVPGFEHHELVRHSINSEIWTDLTTAVKICAFLYPRKEISRIVELVENRDRHKLYNAMEMMEMVLPKKTSRQINEVLDYLLDPLSFRRKPQATPEGEFFVRVIEGHSFNQWTRALCLYTAVGAHQQELVRRLGEAVEERDSPLMKETRSHVLKQLQLPEYDHH